MFIKVGELLAEEKLKRKLYAMEGIGEPLFDSGDTPKAIATAKRKRKKLIREAVLESIVELDEAYHNGWRDGFWDE